MPEQPSYATRREFLAGSLTFLSAASTLPVFLGCTAGALAGPDSRRRGKGDADRILVIVQLAGGNDGLNTVIPCDQDPYYRYRCRLAIPKKDMLRLADGVGLHPAASGLKALYDDGRMAIVQGIGYPNPNRNHFTSTGIWHTADPTLQKHEGWLGRYFDATCKGADPDPTRAIALMKEAPQALQGNRFTPLSFQGPDALTWQARGRDRAAPATFSKLNSVGNEVSAADSTLGQYLQRAALNALIGADEIRSAVHATVRAQPRRFAGGGQLGRSLELVACMIAADLPIRVYYVSMGGFDTHTNQDGRHRRLLREFGDAMKGFVDTLSEDRLLDRVLVMTFSEFGRRVQENAGGGTEHGEAGPMFLFGSKLRPGVHEKHPSLTELHRGDLSFGCDFRRVYAAVLRDWLDVPPNLVLRGEFAPLGLIKPS